MCAECAKRPLQWGASPPVPYIGIGRCQSGIQPPELVRSFWPSASVTLHASSQLERMGFHRWEFYYKQRKRFYATVRCRLCHYTKLPWREIKTKNGLQALTKAKQRKEASAKSVRPARPLQLFRKLAVKRRSSIEPDTPRGRDDISRVDETYHDGVVHENRTEGCSTWAME